jgi:hypothetical protein
MPLRVWCDACCSESGRADKSLRFRREGTSKDSRGREVRCTKCGKILVTYALDEDPPPISASQR